jgi:hypothetical protein
MPSRAGTFASSFALISACASSGPRTPAPPQPSPAALQVVSPPGELAASTAPRAPESSPAAPPPAPLELAARSCTPADWSARKLEQLLTPGSRGNPAYSDRAPVETPAFEAECTDSPNGPSGTGAPVIIDGVALDLAGSGPAGVSGRHWRGNQCRFRLRLADGTGRPVTLGPTEVPPFTAVTSLVRSGSAVWLAVGFNGYAREFPKGGNRVIALDLCAGKVVWVSPDARSNSSLLLLGDYLVTAYGFTSEQRFVYVFDARSGTVLQKLPVVENVCPSKSWAPNYTGGRCDMPGQRVGAATRPRIEDMLLVVDTNTGSSTFMLER